MPGKIIARVVEFIFSGNLHSAAFLFLLKDALRGPPHSAQGPDLRPPPAGNPSFSLDRAELYRRRGGCRLELQGPRMAYGAPGPIAWIQSRPVSRRCIFCQSADEKLRQSQLLP